MGKKIVGYHIDVEKFTHEKIEIEDDLQEIYQLLKVDCIDICTRKIGKKNFTIIVDDNGRLKEDYVISALNPRTWDLLAGNILITNADANGGLQSLTDADVRILTDNIWVMANKQFFIRMD